jgi:hypothetical protein
MRNLRQQIRAVTGKGVGLRAGFFPIRRDMSSQSDTMPFTCESRSRFDA